MTAAAAPASQPDAAARLAQLLMLQQRLRAAPSLTELGYLLVNDLQGLFPHRSAVLWLTLDGGGQVAAVSSLPEPAREATFTVFARDLARHLTATAPTPNGVRVIDPAGLPGDLRDDWASYLPPQACWAPLPGRHGSIGGLLLARDTPWPAEELRVLAHLADAAGHAAEALWGRGRFRPLVTLRRRPWRRGLLAAAVAGGLAALALPVPLSVLAPAEVVARDPLLVRAPLAGVIDRVLVEPNQVVGQGQHLFRLDDVALRTKLDVARQELEVAQAEYRQNEQAAVGDRRSSAKLPLLAARIEQRAAEVAYTQALLDRIEVKAERPGIVLMAEARKLEGKPVVLGERVLTLADPAAAEIELWIGVEDSIPLPEGAAVSLYLNVAPDTVHAARIRTVNYKAEMSPRGTLAYRAVARFVAETPTMPRIGLRGTARLSGETVSLATYLFRRPWAAIRPWLGLGLGLG
jgi:hypothetical protein